MKQKLGQITKEHRILQKGIQIYNKKMLAIKEKVERADEVQRSRDHMLDNYNKLSAAYQKQQQELQQAKMQNAYLLST